MSLLAVAKIEPNTDLVIEYLKESIALYKNGSVYIFLRPMIRVVGPNPVNSINLLFYDDVRFEKDITELLYNKKYMDFLMEREFTWNEETKIGNLDGFVYRPMATREAQPWCQQSQTRPITSLRLTFQESLPPRNDGVLYASYLRLRIEGRNTRLSWRESEKTFITECQFHVTHRDEATRNLLEDYHDRTKRVLIRGHEAWVCVEGKYNLETRPATATIVTTLNPHPIYCQEFKQPELGLAQAAKFERTSETNDWLNEVINIYYRKPSAPRWVSYAALAIATTSLILFLLYNAWPRISLWLQSVFKASQ